MPPVMRSVYSSHVNRIGYDNETGELHVQWDSGKTSVYSGVPAQLADETMNSWSVGKSLSTSIKPTFPHRYLE
jgi:hypothetical protein